ncbi:MAG: polysaccharide deacetylase family protein [Solirubrobacteraceae bacterium]
MSDTDTLDRQEPAARTLARPQLGAGRLDPEIYRRRRGGLALAALAALALLLGMVVGAGSGATPPTHRVAGLGTGYFAQIRTLAGNGPESFAATERAAESAAVSRTLSYTPYVRMAGSQHREIALTFDDGPGPYTPAVLSVLEHQHAPATFFEVGVLERYFHASTAAIVARGYPIGDHTESHAPMSKLSSRDQLSQLLQDTAAIGDFGAPFPRLFRPPYGLWDATTLKLLKRYRMLMVLWSVDTADYQSPGVTTIVERALEGAKPGAIILMHDAGGNRSETVAALPSIIGGLRRRGYKLVTVPRLLLDNPPSAQQNVSTLQGSGG